MNIYVANIPFDVHEDELGELFAAYGEVTSYKIIFDRLTNRSRGFGFVEMANDEEGHKAIEALNGAELGGKNVSVSEARPRKDFTPKFQNNRGGFNRGGGGGGFNRGGGGGFKRNNSGGGGGYNREQGQGGSYGGPRREGGFNREGNSGGGYNREQGQSSGSSYNRDQQGGYNRENNYNRESNYNREANTNKDYNNG